MASCIVQATAPNKFTTTDLVAPDDGFQTVSEKIVPLPPPETIGGNSIFKITSTSASVTITCDIYSLSVTGSVIITSGGIANSTLVTFGSGRFESTVTLYADDTIEFRLPNGDYPSSGTCVGRVFCEGATPPSPSPASPTPVPTYVLSPVNGRLWMFGLNTYGQLGDNSITPRSSPVQIAAGGTDWNQVSTGGGHAVAIKDDMSLWTWGKNNVGQLGDSTVVHKSTPVTTTAGGSTWIKCAAGYDFTIGLKDGGVLWAWGQNDQNQLGDTTTTPRSSPVRTETELIWKTCSAGFSHAAAIAEDNSIWCWGSNSYGECGIGNSFASVPQPAQIFTGGNNWTHVACGKFFTAALKSDGTVWAWGLNNKGQFGNNTLTSNATPTKTVLTAENWQNITAGQSFTAAILGITPVAPTPVAPTPVAPTPVAPSPEPSPAPAPEPAPEPAPVPSPVPSEPDLTNIIVGTKAYFGGGVSAATIYSTIDKLDYATESCGAIAGTLSSSRYYLAGLSDGTYRGYFAGGTTGAVVNTADRITFSDDTTAAVTTANLSTVRQGLAGFDGNSLQGYFAGGYSSSIVTTIDKILYSTESTTAVSPGALQYGRQFLTCLSHNGNKGYFTGGTDNSDFFQYTEFFSVITETSTALSSADLVETASLVSGISGNNLYGYYLGGYRNPTFLQFLDLLTFETDITTRASTAALTSGTSGLAGVSQGHIKGFAAGGATENSILDTINKLVYEFNALFALTSTVLTKHRSGLAGISRVMVPFYLPDPTGDGSYGYFAGGYTGSLVAVKNIDKIQYSTDAQSSSTSLQLQLARYKLAGLSENVTKGYFTGGFTGAQTYTSEKLTYAGETISYVSSMDLDTPTDSLAGISEGIVKGYFVGGFTTSETNVITKIKFSDDTKNTLSSARLTENLSAVATIDGQGLKGYIAGGSNEAGFSTLLTEVMFYSSDTPYNVASASLSDARRYLTGIGNRNNKGYFAGGIGSSYDIIDSVAFSTDTTSVLTSTVLSVPRFGLAGISQGATKGYFGGGRSGTSNLDILEKITFSTDTLVSLSPTVLGLGRNTLAAISQITVPTPTYGGSGSIFIYGDTPAKILYIYPASGTIVIDGGAIILRDLYPYTGAGTITLGGTGGNTPLKNVKWGLPITYAIQNIIEISLPITYYIAQEIYYGYRIEGNCITLENCDGPFNDASLQCPSRTIVTVIARNPKEVCEQLKQQNWVWPVKKFQKYTKPVYKNDEEFLTEQGILTDACPSYEDETFCDQPECQDFCVDYLVQENFTFDGYAIFADQVIVGSGNIIIYGSAFVRRSASILYVPAVWAGPLPSYGYLAGGFNLSSPSTPISALVSVNFSTNIFATSGSETLDTAVMGAAGCSGNFTKGYVLGGFTSNNSGPVADSYTLVYSTGVLTAVAGANLSVARGGAAGVSEGSSKGYVAGGSTSNLTFSAVGDKITYSSDTTAAQTTVNLTQARRGLVGLDGNDRRGYLLGGLTDASLGVAVVTAEKITFSTDTTLSVTSAYLRTAKAYSAGCMGDFYRGYINGGTPTTKSTDRINYTQETLNTIASAELDVPITNHIGINQGVSKGYFAGGYVGTLIRRAYLLNFTTEQASVISNTSLPTNGTQGNGVGVSPYKSYVKNSILGGPEINGTAPVTTTGAGSTTRYTGSGTIFVGGEAGEGGYQGEITEDCTIDMDPFYYVPVLGTTEGTELLPSDITSTLAKCGCANLPLKFVIQTNLNKTSDFTTFLSRSNLTFDPNLIVYYDEYAGLYLHSTHLLGRNNNGSATERWTIVANLNCDNDLENFDTDFVWTLTIGIKRYVAGSNDLDTNIQIWLPSSIICPANATNSIQFNMEVNVNTGSAIINGVTAIKNVFINDRIELFNSLAWKTDSILTINAVAFV